MAYYRCGGGGDLTETTLWTNSSPTSNFSAQEVTLSDSISNYDYIEIVWRVSTSNSTEGAVMMPVSTFIDSGTSYDKPKLSICVAATSALYARRVQYTSDTSVYITICYKVGSSGTSGAYAIPLYIKGVKI